MRVRETAFVVYAMDAPAFPSGEMWPYDPFAPRSRARYGHPEQRALLARSIHQSPEAGEVEGSLIILSGGYLSQDDEMDVSPSEQTEMWQDGCLGMRDRLGDRFAENAIADMLAPDARVTMVLYISRDEAAEHLETVQKAGFDVTVTGDITPGFASNYAVCLGNAKTLKACEWLSQVWPYEPFFFHSNRGSESIVERSIVDAAVKRTNPELAAVDLLKQVEQAPETAQRILGQDYVQCHLTDPDQKSLLIMRQDTDVSRLQALFSRIAKEVGVALYDADSLRLPDGEGRYFSEFSLWDREVTVPEHWRRIA